MKILRISLLLNLFRNTRNQRKFLTYINIGLFLSIFAISAAVISFFIETKIDKIEFKLSEIHKDQRANQKSLNEIVKIQSQFSLIINNEKSINDLYEYIASSTLGYYTISVNDLYLPALFMEMGGNDSKWYQEMGGLSLWSKLSELINERFGKESEEFNDFTESLERLKKYADFFNKDTSSYYEKIFNYDTKKIANEITSKRSINYRDDKIYDDYIIMFKALSELLNILAITERYHDYLDLVYDKWISEMNTEILNSSKLETQVIIFAFIFQFIVFLIIQYFEMISIKNEKGLNAKRKIK